MKCPKCGYMSFDFNEICPKCQRNIISEREKMNHLPFKPETPFLLGALLTRTGDSRMGVELSEAVIVAGTREGMLPLGEELTSGPPPVDLEERPMEESTLESYAPSPDESMPLAVEDLEFEKEEPEVEEKLVEVSTGTGEPGEILGTESSPLDEEALSLELEDLLEADERPELVEEKEADEEALTLEMDAIEPVEGEPHAELATPPDEEPEELFDSFDIGEAELVEEGTQPDEELLPEPAVSTEEASPGEPDELFSPDDLKGYKIGQYDILTQPPPARDRKHPAASSVSDAKTRETKGVWDEISKDLEDLEFDIDES